jgi:hypothetical protein
VRGDKISPSGAKTRSVLRVAPKLAELVGTLRATTDTMRFKWSLALHRAIPTARLRAKLISTRARARSTT